MVQVLEVVGFGGEWVERKDIDIFGTCCDGDMTGVEN